MILDHPHIIDEFSRHFNSRFCSLDFVVNAEKLIAIINKRKPASSNYFILLPCEKADMFNQLVKFRYTELLDAMISRIGIEDDGIEIYTSEMDAALLDFYRIYIEAAKKKVMTGSDPASLKFTIQCPELFLDLTISLFSQLHTEVTSQLAYFNSLGEVYSKFSDKPYSENLYLHSRVSNPYSYFILAYLAENLGVKLKL